MLAVIQCNQNFKKYADESVLLRTLLGLQRLLKAYTCAGKLFHCFTTRYEKEFLHL